jgi:hypothetical protein
LTDKRWFWRVKNPQILRGAFFKTYQPKTLFQQPQKGV